MARTGRENLLTFACIGFAGLYMFLFMYFTGTFEVVQFPILTTVIIIVMLFTACFLFGWIQLGINGALNKVDSPKKNKPYQQVSQQYTAQQYGSQQYGSQQDGSDLLRHLTSSLMRRCPSCGKEQATSNQICIYCGKNLNI